MSTILPKSERLKKAVNWISDHLKEDPQAGLHKLVAEACIRFDLTPRETQNLYGFYELSGKQNR